MAAAFAQMREQLKHAVLQVRCAWEQGPYYDLLTESEQAHLFYKFCFFLRCRRSAGVSPLPSSAFEQVKTLQKTRPFHFCQQAVGNTDEKTKK